MSFTSPFLYSPTPAVHPVHPLSPPPIESLASAAVIAPRLALRCCLTFIKIQSVLPRRVLPRYVGSRTRWIFPAVPVPAQCCW
jgi:hypothetical protein